MEKSPESLNSLLVESLENGRILLCRPPFPNPRLRGRKRALERALQNHLWRPSTVELVTIGLVAAHPSSSKRNDRASASRGAGKPYHHGGVQYTSYEESLRMHSPPLSFLPPCRCLNLVACEAGQAAICIIDICLCMGASGKLSYPLRSAGRKHRKEHRNCSGPKKKPIWGLLSDCKIPKELVWATFLQSSRI